VFHKKPEPEIIYLQLSSALVAMETVQLVLGPYQTFQAQ